MSKVMKLAKIEGKLALRGIDGIVFGIGMPLVVLFLTNMIGGEKVIGATSYTFQEGSFASLLVVGICATAFMGIPLTICDYRDKKILKHFLLPSFSSSSDCGSSGNSSATALLSAIGVAFVSVVFLDYQMKGSWIVLIASYFFVMIAMYSLGLLIASLCKNIKIANLVCTVVYFPMLFLSGAVIPFELFPEGVQKVANVLPLTQGVKLLKSVSLDQPIGDPRFILFLLTVVTIIGFGLAVKLFRWE